MRSFCSTITHANRSVRLPPRDFDPARGELTSVSARPGRTRTALPASSTPRTEPSWIALNLGSRVCASIFVLTAMMADRLCAANNFAPEIIDCVHWPLRSTKSQCASSRARPETYPEATCTAPDRSTPLSRDAKKRKPKCGLPGAMQQAVGQSNGITCWRPNPAYDNRRH